MNGVTFKLTGDKQLDRLFQQLPLRTEKKVLRQALRPAAKLINEGAKQNAPVKTGKLRRSLKVRAGRRTRKNVVRVVVQTGQSDNLFAGETYYGGFLEYGTKRISPRRFIRRAYESRAQQAKDLALRTIRDGIVREARQLGTR